MKIFSICLNTVFAIFPIVGCSSIEAGNARNIEGVEGRKMKDGTWYLYDTPDHWAEFQRMMNMHVELERSGNQRSGGYRTWSEFWSARIHALTPKRQENSDKYIAFIHEARRRAGLPRLEVKTP